MSDSTRQLSLPALRGDDPLGFMATLGLIEVLRSEVAIPEENLALAWDALGNVALLASPFGTVEELVDAVHGAAVRMHADGRLFAAPTRDLIPPTLSEAERRAVCARTGVMPPYDSIRMLRRDWASRLRDLREHGSLADLRWACALVDQCATFPGEETAHVTPLYAPMSRQRMRQVYEWKLRLVAANRAFLHEACVQWRRTTQDAGANIDRRAQRDFAVTTNGDSANAAVTGAEWLALQAVPWFRLGGVHNRPFAWAWDSVGARGRPRALVWPVWRHPLDPQAIETLLSHPLIRRAGSESDQGAALRRLGVVAVLRSERTPLTNSDGPLGAPRVIWPR